MGKVAPALAWNPGCATEDLLATAAGVTRTTQQSISRAGCCGWGASDSFPAGQHPSLHDSSGERACAAAAVISAAHPSTQLSPPSHKASPLTTARTHQEAVCLIICPVLDASALELILSSP